MSTSITSSFLYCLLVCLIFSSASARYEPSWDSLDTRPLPEWYNDAKLGIFIHWGVFSVPSFKSEWFWYNWQARKDRQTVEFMEKNYPPGWTYADFGSQFTAEFFNASKWAKLFESSGAQYVVFVSKHHEGFTNWPSKYSFSWNSKDLGPNRDIVGELAAAVKNETKLHFGLYHSLFEWFNPLCKSDKLSNYTKQDFVDLYELVNNYEPEVIWSDGTENAPSKYWKAEEFIAWLYNDSPVKDTVVVNDRWGYGVKCAHGDFYTCHDRYNPGHVVKHKWENAMTIDSRSWGFRRNTDMSEVLSMEDLLQQLISTVSCNGNMLMNVGPTHYGTISPIYQERLLQMGSWLNVNGEAIYDSRPWTYQNDTSEQKIWYTQNKSSSPKVVYAILLFWPSTDQLVLNAPTASDDTQVTLVGYKGSAFKWSSKSPSGMTVTVPPINLNDMPCQWAWTLKLTNIKN